MVAAAQMTKESTHQTTEPKADIAGHDQYAPCKCRAVSWSAWALPFHN